MGYGYKDEEDVVETKYRFKVNLVFVSFPIDKGMTLPGPPIYPKSGSKGSIRKSKLERGGLWISQELHPSLPRGKEEKPETK